MPIHGTKITFLWQDEFLKRRRMKREISKNDFIKKLPKMVGSLFEIRQE